MNNCNISAKKKFGILLNLMKNNKFSGMSPLNENGEIINDPKAKGQIFNTFFASKSKVSGFEGTPTFGKNRECAGFISFKYISFGGGKIIENLEKVSYFTMWNSW